MRGEHSETATVHVLNRRCFIAAVGALAAGFPLARAIAQDAAPQALEHSELFKEAYAALVAGGTPMEGKVVIELPEIAENGNFVPLTVTVDNPMTDDDYVKTIHVLSTANPVARVATFHLSPLNGVAKVQSRMRLAKTQEVMVLARLSNGLLATASATVKVTIGGCSS